MTEVGAQTEERTVEWTAEAIRVFSQSTSEAKFDSHAAKEQDEGNLRTSEV